MVEARHERAGVGISPDSCCIEGEFTAPYQSGFLTEINDALEELRKDIDPEPLPDARQTGVVGKRLVEGITQVSAVGEVEAGGLDEFSFQANPLEEHDELQLEEHDRID